MTWLSSAGWLLVAGVYGAVVAAGAYLFAVGHPDDGDLAPADTTWNRLEENEPQLARFMARSYREAALLAAAYGVVGFATAVGPLRTGERWAWYASSLLPAFLAAVVVYEQKPEVKRAYGLLAAMALAGWILSARR